MKTKNCIDCGASFDYEPILSPRGGVEVEMFTPCRCETCWRVFDEREKEREQAGKVRMRNDHWKEICPPLYLSTDPDDKRLSSNAKRALDQWQPSRENGIGVGILGATGLGKTRLAYLKLYKLHMDYWRVFSVTSKRLERAISNSFSDDRDRRFESLNIVEDARRCEVLLLDDVGKERFTERVAGDFYDLIETRTSHLRPTIWTANSTAKEITERMGNEHGEPTVRRLIEFSVIVEA